MAKMLENTHPGARRRKRHEAAAGAPRGDAATLRALGEDPKLFAALARELTATWMPANRLEEELVGLMANALWRLGRAQRVQQALAVKRLEKRARKRQAKRALRYRDLRDTAMELGALAIAAEDPNFATGQEQLGIAARLKLRGKLPEFGDQLFCLLLEMKPPGEDAEGEDGASPEDIVPAEGAERARKRRELHELLMRLRYQAEEEARSFQAEGDRLPAWVYAADLAPTQLQAGMTTRMEDADFRRLWRLTNLLMRTQRHRYEGETRNAKSETGN